MDLSLLPGLQPRLTGQLQDLGTHTASDLLMYGEAPLAASLRMSLAHTREAIAYVAGQTAPQPISSLDMLQRDRVSKSTLLTGLPQLDAALRGGLPPSLTELCGAAGAGKTQTCLTLTAVAGAWGVLERANTSAGSDDPPPRSGVVYIDTEGAFSSERLTELLAAHFPQHFARHGSSEIGAANLTSVLSDIVLFRPSNLAEIVETLATLEDTLLEHHVRLIVVDSVAAVARRDFDGGGEDGGASDFRTRSDLLFRLSALLKLLSDTFRIPVVVTNQVTTKVVRTSSGSTYDASGAGSAIASLDVDEELLPALGPSWAHCVNTRLFLQALPGTRGSGVGHLTVMKSAVSPVLSLPYRITAAGIEPMVQTQAVE